MKNSLKRLAALTAAALFAFALQGYHPGAEDDAVYLSAIQKDVFPSLYPYNAQFFTFQVQATIFDKAVAASAKLTHLPVAYTCLLWQLAGIGLLLWGCRRILGNCFLSLRAQAAGVLTIACILSLSVAGTALYISDEHLHPRLPATVAILFAVAAVQRKKLFAAFSLLVVALLFHPIMALFGISFCLTYYFFEHGLPRRFPIAAVFPGAWIFAPASPDWQQALTQHAYYRLSGWTWYEWIGVWAPPLLLWALSRLALRRRNHPLRRISLALCAYSLLQFAVAVLMLAPLRLERLAPLQPMRYLHLTFLLMALLGGGYLGEYMLGKKPMRWALVFVPLALANGYAQRLRYPATRNLELPWQQPQNPWVRSFAWIQANTPADAVFALDPLYLDLPGEDHHSFRALAKHSSLVDDQKDAAVAVEVPSLASVWVRQRESEKGWEAWKLPDFERLARTTPVRWVVVAPRQAFGLDCPYAQANVRVCRIGNFPETGKPEP